MKRTAKRYVQTVIFAGEKNPEAHRRRFNPTRKKLKNLVASVKLETQTSKLDQVNLQFQKEEWAKWADCYFDAYQSGNISHFENDLKANDDSEDDDDEGDDDEGGDDDDGPIENLNEQGKLCFVYQSKSMKRLYRRYCPHVVLLDATYKTTKYLLPLFFLVAKTNVSYQIVGIIVIQEESTELITKALSIIKSWSPGIIPKYGMVDFDEK